MMKNQISRLVSQMSRAGVLGSWSNGVASQQYRSISTTGATYKSRYTKYYIFPIHQEENLQELRDAGEAEKLAFVPVRAAPVNQSNSIWFDPIVTTFTNMVMRKGRKEVARFEMERVWRNLKRHQLDKYYEATTDEERAAVILNPWELFHKAIENCTPLLETTPIVRGGTTYQVPVPVHPKKGQFLAMKWMIELVKTRGKKTNFFHEQMTIEILEAANDSGRVVKKKQDLHKLCEANRAYAHFRWS